ncbi:MAG: tRNA pseudouridine(55) synthase TruB [Candidatus Pacebacteria bacterium]|nr:tRNA pseudouridine(55) synthase TruB [Candidatus Paceibacterota bacterium]
MKKPVAKNYIEPDVLLVHKPKGISSFDVIRKIRPILGTRKIGHAGTLDPLASGLMILGINSGTKKLTNYLKLPKTYIAEILIGTSTVGGDLEGEIIEQVFVDKNEVRSDEIEHQVLSMKGSHMLQVPLYSAIKVEGKPLYDYARENKQPPYIPEKEMNILHIQMLDSYRKGTGHVVKVRLEVSSGTYIRTLGEEFGRRVGYPATLQNLYRVKIADFRDSDAYRFPETKGHYPGFVRAIMNMLFGKKK